MHMFFFYFRDFRVLTGERKKNQFIFIRALEMCQPLRVRKVMRKDDFLKKDSNPKLSS